MNEPVDLYAAKDGSLYVVDRGNHRVMKYNLNGGMNGTQIGDDRGSGPRQLDTPVSIAVDEEMNIVYISDYGNSRIQLWNDGGRGEMVETVVGGLGQNLSDNDIPHRADDIQLDPLLIEAIYASDSTSNIAWAWLLKEKMVVRRILRLARPMGIYLDSRQSLYVAECVGNKISQWSNLLRIDETPPPGSTPDQFNCSSAVVVDNDGSMFVADTNHHRIVRWEPNARQGVCIAGCSASRGNGANQLAEPRDVTFDWKGNLLVADTGNNRVQRYDLLIDQNCGK